MTLHTSDSCGEEREATTMKVTYGVLCVAFVCQLYKERENFTGKWNGM